MTNIVNQALEFEDVLKKAEKVLQDRDSGSLKYKEGHGTMDLFVWLGKLRKTAAQVRVMADNLKDELCRGCITCSLGRGCVFYQKATVNERTGMLRCWEARHVEEKKT